VSGDFEHCAHVDVGVELDEEDASAVVLELVAVSVGFSVGSAMVGDCIWIKRPTM
jgi:hypothetical protein